MKNLLNNDTLNVIATRHSVRNFSRRPVPDEILNIILNAANQAPSAHNQQSWKFIIIKGNFKNKFSALVLEEAASYPRPSSSLLRMAARSIYRAPVVIAVLNTGELIKRGASLYNSVDSETFDFFRTMEIQSSAAAVENMLLAVHSLGLGAVWLGILYLIKTRILKFFKEPEGEFMAVIPIGYPVKLSTGPGKKELDKIIAVYDK